MEKNRILHLAAFTLCDCRKRSYGHKAGQLTKALVPTLCVRQDEAIVRDRCKKKGRIQHYGFTHKKVDFIMNLRHQVPHMKGIVQWGCRKMFEHDLKD